MNTTEIPQRPSIKNRLDRHIEEMLWTGRWSYLRFYHLDRHMQLYGAELRTIMSFGCGYGKHEAALALKYPQVRFIGIDIDERAIAECTKKFGDIPNLSFLCENILQHRESYDLIFSVEVLEHIPDPQPVLDELARRTHNLLIIVPNFLERHDNPEGREKMWKQHAHYHIGFSIMQLQNMLTRCGFHTVEAHNIYFENLTTKVRSLFQHLRDHYPALVNNDMQLLALFRELYDLDSRCSTWLEGKEEGQGTLVFAQRPGS